MNFSKGERITITLQGTVASTRNDPDGLKINVRGEGFFIWVDPSAPDVEIERETETADAR